MRRIPSVPIPRTYCSLAFTPHSPPRLRNGSFSHASRSDGQRNLLGIPPLPRHPAVHGAGRCSTYCVQMLCTARRRTARNAAAAATSAASTAQPLLHIRSSAAAHHAGRLGMPGHAGRTQGATPVRCAAHRCARPTRAGPVWGCPGARSLACALARTSRSLARSDLSLALLGSLAQPLL